MVVGDAINRVSTGSLWHGVQAATNTTIQNNPMTFKCLFILPLGNSPKTLNYLKSIHHTLVCLVSPCDILANCAV